MLRIGIALAVGWVGGPAIVDAAWSSYIKGKNMDEPWRREGIHGVWDVKARLGTAAVAYLGMRITGLP